MRGRVFSVMDAADVVRLFDLPAIVVGIEGCNDERIDQLRLAVMLVLFVLEGGRHAAHEARKAPG